MHDHREEAWTTWGWAGLGEEEAVRYLETRGWTILGRNVRLGRREVDVIASRGRVLAFVEVKCRTGLEASAIPLEAITRAKRMEIARVARGWLHREPSPPALWSASMRSRCPGRRRAVLEVLHLPDAWRMD